MLSGSLDPSPKSKGKAGLPAECQTKGALVVLHRMISSVGVPLQLLSCLGTKKEPWQMRPCHKQANDCHDCSVARGQVPLQGLIHSNEIHIMELRQKWRQLFEQSSLHTAHFCRGPGRALNLLSAKCFIPTNLILHSGLGSARLSSTKIVNSNPKRSMPAL